jgi:phage-related minor tail protein
MDMTESVTFEVRADTRAVEQSLENLRSLSTSFGTQLTAALRSATVGGKALDDTLRQVALNLAGMALNQGLRPLSGLLGGLFSGLMGGIMPFAKGGVVPFADGGVVAAPTYFPMRGGVGLAGEAGPEAILPLARGSDGRLGVAAGAGGGGVSVVFNVSSPDAASFRKSEAQITGMLARAVRRGARTL